MHVHMPKPLHGWRALIGEVGIIVVGVLIALGAEQVVENLRWRREVSDFRNAVDHELGRNFGIFAAMIKQKPCVDRRLGELEQFLADSNAGRQDRLLRPIGRPFSQSQYFSVWDEKGTDVTEHLPLETRLKYSELYDEFRNFEVNRLSERDVWRSLAQFDQPEPLDHGDRMRLRELLTRAEQLNDVKPSNYAYIDNIARPLNVRPIADPQNLHLAYESDYCRPLLAR